MKICVEIYSHLFSNTGGGVRSLVRILLGSAKSATRNVIVGLWFVPGFGYLQNKSIKIKRYNNNKKREKIKKIYGEIEIC